MNEQFINENKNLEVKLTEIQTIEFSEYFLLLLKILEIIFN